MCYYSACRQPGRWPAFSVLANKAQPFKSPFALIECKRRGRLRQSFLLDSLLKQPQITLRNSWFESRAGELPQRLISRLSCFLSCHYLTAVKLHMEDFQRSSWTNIMSTWGGMGCSIDWNAAIKTWVLLHWVQSNMHLALWSLSNQLAIIVTYDNSSGGKCAITMLYLAVCESLQKETKVNLEEVKTTWKVLKLHGLHCTQSLSHHIV